MKKTLETKLILESWDRFLNERGNGYVFTSILNKIERECVIVCTSVSSLDIIQDLEASGVEFRSTSIGSDATFFDKRKYPEALKYLERNLMFYSTGDFEEFDYESTSSAPIFIVDIESYSGDFNEINSSPTFTEKFEWLLHDIGHMLYETSHGFETLPYFNELDEDTINNYKKFLNNSLEIKDHQVDVVNKLRPDNVSPDDFKPEEIQSGKVNAIKGVSDLVNELTSWFTEINYTKFVGHDDIFPSIVSYCLLRMPAPSNLSGLKKHIDTLQLSDIAKLYLLLVNHKVNEDFDPENSNSILFSRFRNKIVFFS
jgi:hypothetical protein